MKNVEVFDEVLRSGGRCSFIVEDDELAYYSGIHLPSPSEPRGQHLTDFSQPSRSIVFASIKYANSELKGVFDAIAVRLAAWTCCRG
jgi:hypothetical protein